MIGQTISHYTILKKLGEGGMDEVYLAEDSKLERKVALKFLPAHYTADPQVNARFQREAKAAAALNHPNIITVYEIGEHEGRTYIAMEYVDGQSLRDVIVGAKHSSAGIVAMANQVARNAAPLRMPQIIGILSQVCEGLAKAHQAGIVHRDLKPENIMLDRNGKVRILDFGLAQMQGKSRLTSERSTMGTLYYMSPEQCEGINVDHRTDIWAVGVMLYEMVTGRLPFEAEYQQAVLYSILHEQPEPLARYKTGVSPDLQRIVDKALDKDRDTRYQNITDLLTDLKRERKSSSISKKAISSARSRKMKRAVLRYAAMAAVVVLAVVAGMFVFKPQPAPKMPAKHTQVTFVGDAAYPAISPDEQFVAYARGKTGDGEVFVEDLVGGQALNVSSGIKFIDGAPGASIIWSPNGTGLTFSGYSDSLIFSRPAGAFNVPRLGGKARLTTIAFLNSWSPDGTYIAHAYNNWKSIEITKADDRLKSDIDINGAFDFLIGIRWSPLSNRLLFLTQGNEQYTIWTIKIDGNEKQIVVEDNYRLSSPRWAANGKAIYYFRTVGRSKQFMKVAVSPETGKATTKPESLQSGMEAGDAFGISADNRRLYYARELRYSNLWLVRFDENEKAQSPIQLTKGTLANFAPSFSPDGEKIAFSIAKGEHANIFVIPTEGGEMQQLTYMNTYSSSPVWSPDGRELAFGVRDEEGTHVWTVSVSGGMPHPFNSSSISSDSFLLTWAPGSEILYQRPGNRNFHLLDPRSEKELPLVQSESMGWMFHPAYSPDGKAVAVFRLLVVDEFQFGTPGIWRISLTDYSQKLLQEGPLNPIIWSNDGRWIYALSNEKKPYKVLKVAADGEDVKHFYTLPVEEIEEINKGIDLTPDGKKLVYPAVERHSDVWVMEHFDPENELEAPIAIPDFPEYKQFTYLEDGVQLISEKQYTEAEDILRQGLELNPDNIHLLLQLGISLHHQSKYVEAEAIYSKALALAPNHSGILNEIRQTAFLNRNYEAARKYNENYLKNPRFGKAAALVSLVAIDILEKNYDSAASNLHKALQVDSTYAPAYTHLGYLYTEQERFKEALPLTENAFLLDSTFANYNLLAWVLVSGEIDLDRGIGLAEKALDSKPENWAHTADVYSYLAIPEHTLGLAYLKKGEFEKAVQYLEQAAEFASERQAIREDLQRAREQLQEKTRR